MNKNTLTSARSIRSSDHKERAFSPGLAIRQSCSRSGAAGDGTEHPSPCQVVQFATFGARSGSPFPEQACKRLQLGPERRCTEKAATSHGELRVGSPRGDDSPSGEGIENLKVVHTVPGTDGEVLEVVQVVDHEHKLRVV